MALEDDIAALEAEIAALEEAKANGGDVDEKVLAEKKEALAKLKPAPAE
jgi:hypothetical protein